ncbi:dual specificity protein phosphatase 4 [Phascolarctos cinereus]|uniref:Dual specificity protein phosphatase n=1 Tax=Phascolarctos cinereus TaxID=38626 RepID=A0A6P5JN38_PHACI|nr:dual specificity protein phosphatase 4 [Phascolarctos cinereus]
MVTAGELRELEGSALRRLLRRDERERAGGPGVAPGGGTCLLLDCRPFLAHSAGCIRGALPVRCHTIARRRAPDGPGRLEQLLPAADGPDAEDRGRRLRAGLYAAVVLYDQRSRRAAEALRAPDGALAWVVRALRGAVPRAPAPLYLLRGGYEMFSSEYPEFCSQAKPLATVSSPIPTTIPEPPDLGSSSCGTPLHDQGGPVEILPFLYLGSAQHAARRDTLDALGITALLNVSLDCPNHFEAHYQYKSIPVEDSHKADIGSWFMDAIEFIDSVQARQGRVLVHCQAGISRSATICLAYLMMKKKVRLETAFEFVKQRRSVISPNFSFMGQLLQFESQVLATSCAAEAASPSVTVTRGEPAKASPSAAQLVFSFPVSAPSSLPYLPSPITTFPSC